MKMGSEVWFQELFVKPPRICGQQLKPYSVHHSFLLRNLGNPLIVGGEVTDNDLLSAILICSLSHEASQDLIYNPKSIRWGWWLFYWSLKDLTIARESFIQYVSEYLTVPEHWKKETGSDGDEIAAPFEMHLVLALCSKYNCSLSEAWNFPLALARCYYDVWAENEGDTTIVSERQYALIKEGQKK